MLPIIMLLIEKMCHCVTVCEKQDWILNFMILKAVVHYEKANEAREFLDLPRPDPGWGERKN